MQIISHFATKCKGADLKSAPSCGIITYTMCFRTEPKGQIMKKQVTVTYSKDLLRRYFSYVFDKKGTRTKTVFAVSAAVFAVFCVLSVIFYSRNTVVADVNLFYVFLGISVISLAVIAVYALAMCLYPRLSSKKMSRTLGRTVVVTSFPENSFSAALPDGRGKKTYPAPSLVGFAVAKGCIFVYGNSSAAFILPFDKETETLLETKLKRL